MLLLVYIALLLSACHFGHEPIAVKSLVATQRTVLAQVKNGERTFESAFRHFVVKQDYVGLHNLLQHESFGNKEQENIYRLLLSGAVGEGSDVHEIHPLLHRVLDSGRMHAQYVVSTIISKNLSQSLKSAADNVVALYRETVASWSSKEGLPVSTEKVANSLVSLSNAYEEFEYLYLNIGQGNSSISSSLRNLVDRSTQEISRNIARATLQGAFASPRQDFLGIIDQLRKIVLSAMPRYPQSSNLYDKISDFREYVQQSHLWSPDYSHAIVAYNHSSLDDRLLDREIVRYQLDGSSVKEKQIFDNTIDEAISLTEKYLDASWEQRLTKVVEVIEKVALKSSGIEMTQEVVGVVAEEAGVSVADITQDRHDEQKEKIAKLATQLQQKGYDKQKVITKTLEELSPERSDRVTRASFLFVGSEQATKVDTAKIIAKFSPSPMKEVIQIKMDEYLGQQGVYSIVGRPSAYDIAGNFTENHYGGTLADKIRATPQSVVLFELGDKIDGSSDRSALDILIEILSEGRLTDSFGNLVSFHDAIVIVTANTVANETLDNDFFDAVVKLN